MSSYLDRKAAVKRNRSQKIDLLIAIGAGAAILAAVITVIWLTWVP